MSRPFQPFLMMEIDMEHTTQLNTIESNTLHNFASLAQAYMEHAVDPSRSKADVIACAELAANTLENLANRLSGIEEV